MFASAASAQRHLLGGSADATLSTVLAIDGVLALADEAAEHAAALAAEAGAELHELVTAAKRFLRWSGPTDVQRALGEGSLELPADVLRATAACLQDAVPDVH